MSDIEFMMEALETKIKSTAKALEDCRSLCRMIVLKIENEQEASRKKKEEQG